MDFQVDRLITKGSTGQVNTAEMAGISDPSLFSELTGCGKEKPVTFLRIQMFSEESEH